MYSPYGGSCIRTAFQRLVFEINIICDFRVVWVFSNLRVRKSNETNIYFFSILFSLILEKKQEFLVQAWVDCNVATQ